MGWPPELDDCIHNQKRGFCEKCAWERELDRNKKPNKKELEKEAKLQKVLKTRKFNRNSKCPRCGRKNWDKEERHEGKLYCCYCGQLVNRDKRFKVG